MKKIVAVIPARYQSSRFPGKPLALIVGKPMIEHVYTGVRTVKDISDVIVATDNTKIFDTVIAFGGKAVMTDECSCGTERVYEAIKDMDCDVVLNIQGDEPLIRSEMIQEVINAFSDEDVYMATLKKKIELQKDVDNPNNVKVITDVNNNAIYFSRYPIPYNRDGRNVNYYKHLGVYGYTKTFLEKYVKMPRTELEMIESLEQLRVLENGYDIKVMETEYESIGVDAPEDIELVEREMKKFGQV